MNFNDDVLYIEVVDCAAAAAVDVKSHWNTSQNWIDSKRIAAVVFDGSNTKYCIKKKEEENKIFAFSKASVHLNSQILILCGFLMNAFLQVLYVCFFFITRAGPTSFYIYSHNRDIKNMMMLHINSWKLARKWWIELIWKC